MRQSKGYRSNFSAQLPTGSTTSVSSRTIAADAGQQVRVSVRATYESVPDVVQFQSTARTAQTSALPAPTPSNSLMMNSPIVVIPAQPQSSIGEIIVAPSPPRINLVGIAQFLGKTLSLQRKKKQEDVKPLPDNTLTAQRTTASVPKPAAKLILEVFERNGSTPGARLAVYEKLVTDAGATTWEELALGAELNRAVYLKVTIENTTTNMPPARFDDLKIEVFNAPVAMVVQENSYYPFGGSMRGLDYLQTAGKEDKFQYNGGAEKNTDFGLNLYETQYRLYDPLAPHFVQVDPKAEDGGQESLSPYQYSFNNPIRYNDPKGDCPQCWGAVVGAGVEIGVQIAGNLASGKRDLRDVLDLDWVDVGVATLAGAATVGLSSISAAGKVAKFASGIGGEVIKASVDLKASSGLTTVGGGKTTGEFAVDLAAGAIGGAKVAGTAKEVVNAVVNPKRIKAAEAQINAAEKRLTKAFTEAGVAKGKKELGKASLSLMANEAVGKVVEAGVTTTINVNADTYKTRATNAKTWGFSSTNWLWGTPKKE